MNTDLLRTHIHRLRDEGVESEDVACRLGINPDTASRLYQEPLGEDAWCSHCGCDLDYRSAVLLDSTLFCKDCRAWLFANHDAACLEYPSIFGDYDGE